MAVNSVIVSAWEGVEEETRRSIKSAKAEVVEGGVGEEVYRGRYFGRKAL